MTSARGWRHPIIALLALMTLLMPAPATAQVPREAPPSAGEGGRPARPATARLPPDSVTQHSVDLPGRSLPFKAIAGSIPLLDANDGSLQAEVAYIAYLMAERSERPRPVTFVFNGGPGAASAYLHLGAVGPWRLPFDEITPSASPRLVSNAQTWLDFSDLVFVDPPGTGYSQITVRGDGPRRQFWSVNGDAEALAVFVRKWIEKFARQPSPKFLVGESYGGFRAAKIARALQEGQDVGVRGLVLISPVLDFGLFGLAAHAPMSWVARLPAMAATAREAKGPFDREALREVEHYAAGEYLRDLLRGPRDAAAVERMSARVAAFTGLDRDLVRRLAGRVDGETFAREFYRGQGVVASAYDATVTASDPNPHAARPRWSDPMLSALAAPLTNGMTDLYRRVLGWHVEDQYRLQSHEANGRWDWGRGRVGPQAVDDLVRALATDRRLRVLVTHGASDLVTPYFGTKLIIDQLPAFAAERLTFALYGGGHMYYSRDVSRRALRVDAEALYRAALEADALLRD
ncbi:MAG TPA: alpha/beta hydrolase [Xanthobacteraceae bacterium]